VKWMSLHALRAMSPGTPGRGILQGRQIGGGGDPIPPIRTSVIELCVQGHQKSNRLIGSIV